MEQWGDEETGGGFRPRSTAYCFSVFNTLLVRCPPSVIYLHSSRLHCHALLRCESIINSWIQPLLSNKAVLLKRLCLINKKGFNLPHLPFSRPHAMLERRLGISGDKAAAPDKNWYGQKSSFINALFLTYSPSDRLSLCASFDRESH